MNSRGARILVLVAAIAAAVVLFVVLQDDGDSGDSDTASTTTQEQSTGTGTEASPAAPTADVIQVRNGAPVGGVQELTFEKGDRVLINVELDEPYEEVHLHGYDIEVDSPTKVAKFDFTADIEGIFELEGHGPAGDVPLAEITVEPS